ncbi:amidohydrolase family protein [Neolewinella aurantiaca]|uniref:Amidohydrolase family protein n=1 Tax=Neolewinella aurantiaca TaxID=2602767 RepID=A0A5C7FM02_9BACT|nr:amidohydrolase family protein [Neolewinella aurantiaca]TXF91098.1 amidohydrolase family protein [Neolewinella aurantiaca]
MKKYNIIFLLLFAVATSMTAQTEKGSIHIKNGTVITITNGILENADVVITDGKITGIGKSLKAPKGAKVVDATGQFVMPGIIDAHSHIALDAVNEATNIVTAEVETGDVLDPLDVGIYRALAGGVTATHAMHGSANAIGGQCETIKLRYGTYDPEELKMEGAPRTIKFALGENPIRVHGEGNRLHARTRMGIEQVFRRAFSEARDYMTAQEDYNKKMTSDPQAVPPMYDRRMEALADILRGDIIIHCHSYRADEILMLMNVCKDFGIEKIVYQHVNEGFKVAPELAEFGAMASVFADWWAYKFEVYYSTAYNAAILTRNGVVTSINSDSGDYIRHLYHQAGKTQRYGKLTDNEALRLITLNPAIQLGIEDRVGSLEKGKDGDIAIFNAHPLSVYAVPQMTIVDGIVRFDIKEDNNDMRMSVDPEDVDAMMLDYDHDHRCMEGAAEELFHH